MKSLNHTSEFMKSGKEEDGILKVSGAKLLHSLIAGGRRESSK